MQITSHIFEAYLKCPTKCWLRSLGAKGTGNIYSEWVRTKSETYLAEGVEQLLNGTASKDVATPQAGSQNVKTAKWKFAQDFRATKEKLESTIHIVERIPSESRGRPARFTPIRYFFRNKLSKDDKLLLAYDAHVLSEMLGRDIGQGKIIHGENHIITKVSTSLLVSTIRRLISKISTLLVSDSPPALILSRHCAECEYQFHCRQKAIEKDDLSLLAGMTEKERKKLNNKGIFTITQLSYTFRPRRRPKRLRNKREKYHDSLKALAIREKKIHIVGSPELKIEGIPVYIDVEGLPDRDFYYLIGVRICNGDSVEQHSLWADGPEDEGRIWSKLVELLGTIENPVLIHYGSYEASFIKTMSNRYGASCAGSNVEKSLSSLVNLLSVVYSQVYFPVASNGLKEIAGYCGSRWSERLASGIQSIVWREQWEISRARAEQEKLICYNAEDCKALEVVTRKVLSFQYPQLEGEATIEKDIVDISKLKREHPYGFKRNNFLIPEFEKINRAAYWDYQRERVYLKTNRSLKQSSDKGSAAPKPLVTNQIVECAPPTACKYCGSGNFIRHSKKTKTIIDLKFMKHGIKRWIKLYKYNRYLCKDCGFTFSFDYTYWDRSKLGAGLMSYLLYQGIELRVPLDTVEKSLNRLFGLELGRRTAFRVKSIASEKYDSTYNSLLMTLCKNDLIHSDETKINMRNTDGFVWVFASMNEVAYFYTETREGDYVQSLLKDFKGVLVSDFYAVYDSINCPQQKCLIHLIRDINDALYKHPYDEGLKLVAESFTNLLRPMVETVDRFGLKHHFLKKHLPSADRFYKDLLHMELMTETAIKIRERFEKNRDKLFTFLNYDGIPWNNNNAEHAVKPFAMLRNIIKGITTEKGLREYLILLSICETCKYRVYRDSNHLTVRP